MTKPCWVNQLNSARCLLLGLEEVTVTVAHSSHILIPPTLTIFSYHWAKSQTKATWKKDLFQLNSLLLNRPLSAAAETPGSLLTTGGL